MQNAMKIDAICHTVPPNKGIHDDICKIFAFPIKFAHFLTENKGFITVNCVV